MTKSAIQRTIQAAVALCFVGSAAVVHADSLPFVPTFTIGTVTLTNDAVVANPDGSFTVSGEQQGGSFNGGAVWDMTWNLTLNQDPSVSGTLTLTNLTNTVRNFAVTFGLPVSPAFSPSVHGGSISATLTDAGGAVGAQLAPTTNPAIYRGTIDGTTVMSLFGASLSCNSGSLGCFTSLTDQDGLPGPTLPGGAVNSSIGMLLNFSLTPGDKVEFATNFQVEPVPLPAAAPLLLFGFGAFAAARRRRRV